MEVGRAENTRGMYGTFINVSDLPAIDWANRARMFQDNNPSADCPTVYAWNADQLRQPFSALSKQLRTRDRCYLGMARGSIN